MNSLRTPDEQQELKRFGDLVLADRELHDRLRAAENLDAFVALAVRLGAEQGCGFSAASVRGAVEEQRRAWLERWL